MDRPPLMGLHELMARLELDIKRSAAFLAFVGTVLARPAELAAGKDGIQSEAIVITEVIPLIHEGEGVRRTIGFGFTVHFYPRALTPAAFRTLKQFLDL